MKPYEGRQLPTASLIYAPSSVAFPKITFPLVGGTDPVSKRIQECDPYSSQWPLRRLPLSVPAARCHVSLQDPAKRFHKPVRLTNADRIVRAAPLKNVVGCLDAACCEIRTLRVAVIAEANAAQQLATQCSRCKCSPLKCSPLNKQLVATMVVLMG